MHVTNDTLTIHVEDVPVTDQFVLFGTGTVPATVSFTITYTKIGSPRQVVPASDDPLSPLTWAGEMSMATNSGHFSVAYANGSSFSASGNFSSSGFFGEMGTERNGSQVDPEDFTAARQGNNGAEVSQNDPAGFAAATAASEKLATALNLSRARAMRAWRSDR